MISPRGLPIPPSPANSEGIYLTMRSELRRIGRNLSIKQLNALAALHGQRGVEVCDFKESYRRTPGRAGCTLIEQQRRRLCPSRSCPRIISDGMVDITLDYRKGTTSDSTFKPPSFIITFYDLPYIDNKVLDKDMRLGVVLSKYVETGDLDRFR